MGPRSMGPPTTCSYCFNQHCQSHLILVCFRGSQWDEDSTQANCFASCTLVNSVEARASQTNAMARAPYPLGTKLCTVCFDIKVESLVSSEIEILLELAREASQYTGASASWDYMDWILLKKIIQCAEEAWEIDLPEIGDVAESANAANSDDKSTFPNTSDISNAIASYVPSHLPCICWFFACFCRCSDQISDCGDKVAIAIDCRYRRNLRWNEGGCGQCDRPFFTDFPQ